MAYRLARSRVPKKLLALRLRFSAARSQGTPQTCWESRRPDALQVPGPTPFLDDPGRHDVRGECPNRRACQVAGLPPCSRASASSTAPVFPLSLPAVACSIVVAMPTLTERATLTLIVLGIFGVALLVARAVLRAVFPP